MDCGLIRDVAIRFPSRLVEGGQRQPTDPGEKCFWLAAAWRKRETDRGHLLAVQQHAKRTDTGVIRDYTGHRDPNARDPPVPNFGRGAGAYGFGRNDPGDRAHDRGGRLAGKHDA